MGPLRFAVILLSCAGALCFGPAALAAPTCLDRAGDTIRCGAPGAMPVGWTLSPQKLWDKEISRPAEENLDLLAKVICGLALFFAMIALMPKFDGTRPEDWDPRQDNDKKG